MNLLEVHRKVRKLERLREDILLQVLFMIHTNSSASFVTLVLVTIDLSISQKEIKSRIYFDELNCTDKRFSSTTKRIE
jgi:hypothetical protein